MPLYTYKCTKCNKTFDEFRSIADRKTATCPDCGTKSNKIFTPVVGWVTDTKNPTRC